MRSRMKFAAAGLGACALAALAIAPPAGAAHLRNVSEKVFPFAAGGDIVIESTNGRIVVEAWDRSDVRVQITREVRASTDEMAKALLRELKADVAVHPGEIRIESVFPKKQKVVGFWDLIGHGVQSMNIHYYLQVPRQASLDLNTSNGAIRVRAVHGRIVVATNNGDVDVAGVRGTLVASTRNGEVRLARIEGATNASTTNGSIAAEMAALPDRGRMEMTTTNGNIELALPRDLHAELEAETTNGRVNINYRLTTQGTINSKRIRGTIGGGGVRIELQTTNGNIDVGPPRARASS